MPGLFEGAFGDGDRAVPVMEHDERLFAIEAHKNPLLALVGEDTEMAKNSLQDWEIEVEGLIPLSGVKDGEAVTVFNSQTLGSLESYVGHVREGWKVTKVGGLVKSAGVKDQIGYQRKKALERLLTKMERIMGSGIEMQRGNKNDAYMTRGAFAWMIPALQTLVGKEVPAEFQSPAASLHIGSLATFNADAFEAMLNAASEQTKGSLDLVGQVGLALKSHMSGWTQKVDLGAGTAEPLINYTGDISDKRLLRMVNVFEFDAGVVEVMVNHNLLYGVNGAKTAHSSHSGIFMNLDLWKKRYMQRVKEYGLPEDGGGTRGYADAIMMLKCGCPAGQAAVYSDTAV